MQRVLLLAFLGCGTRVEPDRDARWQVITDSLDRVALTVWVAGDDDVWIGGGGLGSGGGALVLHGDGVKFAEVPTGRSETIWWISGTARDDVWAVGERGLALRGNGARFDATETGTTAPLYGVWASARDDAWAVGGDPNGKGPTDVLLHWDGRAWSAVAAPTKGATLFKVWGRARNEVFAVGTGVALHFDGSSWRALTVPTKTSLFTVHGGDAGVFAVGGGPATLLGLEAGTWTVLPLPETANGILSGVSVARDGTVFVVGERMQRYRRVNGIVHDESDTGSTLAGIDLHAAAAYRDGAIAVGGNYMALMRPGTKARGAIVRFGR